jgi:tRNA (mo5U34)-methyltransferase
MSLAEEVSKHVWFHTIDLGDGVVTPGNKTIELMSLEAELFFSSVDLRGKSLLDVGAWNGGFSVEAARRGAERVVALDHYTWNHPHFRGRATFDLVAGVFGNRFEAIDRDLDQPRLSLQDIGQFDVVLFAGVFYHLVDPIAALRELAPLAKDLLILETHVEETADERPSMIFFPGAELAGDPTNWWGPNVACIMALLRMAGFDHIGVSVGSAYNRRVFHARRAHA